ncbi:MAG: response regulator transcription factor [Lachnospiraceae bacterium]|nr:response regulator transcription factor [Lachnospiraceae bacterium]
MNEFAGKKILVTDDDVSIGDMLEEALKAEAYKVCRAYSGTEALMVIEKEKPDLVLLDLMLPGLSGEEVLPKLSGIPVIVVSAKTDIDNRIKLLYEGACDYISKPFVIAELLARIAVQLRLAGTKEKNFADDSGDTLAAGGVELDFELLRAVCGGSEISLTRTEAAILRILMSNPDRPISRGTILDRISEDTPDCTERSLKQHISNIRKKLQAADGIDHIEAVYGIGFKFN